MTAALTLIWLATLQSRVVINEVMANPAGSNSQHALCPEDRNEFVELYNVSDDTIDLQGWCLSDFDDVDTLCAWADTAIRVKYPHVRINDTRILPHGFAVVLDPEYTDPEPESGFVQPYRFTDRLLVLRPGNSTIGNGLANTDPLMLWSSDSADVSTFGAYAGASGFPSDAGDGVSWERVSPDAPDSDSSWYRSRDLDGCTPGRANSAATYQNLACEEFLCYPLSYAPGQPETLTVTVRNAGRVRVNEWQVRFLVNDTVGRMSPVEGNSLDPGARQVLTAVWQPSARARYRLTVVVECAGDQDSTDDRRALVLDLAAGQQCFSLQTSRFGPNLKTSPETLHIAYSLPDVKGTLAVSVLDLNARERAVLFNGKPPAQNGALTWSGLDRNGRLLPTGLYVIVCEYKSGKTVIFEKKTVVLAKGRGE
jgi:hypothetical protein